MGLGCHVQMDYSQTDYIKLKLTKKVVDTITVAITPHTFNSQPIYVLYGCKVQCESSDLL